MQHNNVQLGKNRFGKMVYLPYACDSSDLRELKIKQNVFLIINNINSRPVYSHYHVILRQTGAWELVSFVKSGEQQRPLITSIVDNVFFDFLRINLLSCVVSLLDDKKKALKKKRIKYKQHGLNRHEKQTWQSLYVHSLSAISLHVFTFSQSPFTYPHSFQTFLCWYNIPFCGCS